MIKVMFTFTKPILVGIMLGAIVGCLLSTRVTYNQLLLKNDGDIRIVIFLNLSYPDSSFANAFLDGSVYAMSQDYIGNSYILEERTGLTVFVMSYSYFKSRWHENAGTPDKYLEVDSILQRYVLSKAQLDSLSWTVVFPYISWAARLWRSWAADSLICPIKIIDDQEACLPGKLKRNRQDHHEYARFLTYKRKRQR